MEENSAMRHQLKQQKVWLQSTIHEYKKTVTIYKTSGKKHKVLEYNSRISEVEGFIKFINSLLEPSALAKINNENSALNLADVSQQSEPLFAFDEIEKELLKRISGNGLQISRFMEWLKANYGG